MRILHRLLLKRYRIDPGAMLNDGATGQTPAIPPRTAKMLECLRRLVAEATRADGEVDYRHLRASAGYARYRAEAERLRGFDPNRLRTREERLAFWINLYNALVIDGVARLGVSCSVNQVPGFFWRVAYNVGGRRYSANDVEHGILRANRGHPLIPGPHFGPSDPRRELVAGQADPRVHFALVCASRSCPPIRSYTSERIDEQLDLATAVFLKASSEVDVARRRVRLSRIFLWYAPDFGGPPLGLGDRTGLRRSVARMARPIDGDLSGALEDPAYRLEFAGYDWGLNGIG